MERGSQEKRRDLVTDYRNKREGGLKPSLVLARATREAGIPSPKTGKMGGKVGRRWKRMKLS